MTVKFGPYDSRERVAGMLEGPVRTLRRAGEGLSTTVGEGQRAQSDVATILAELDRLDRVEAAQAKLNADSLKYKRELVAEKVKVVPITDGTPTAYCSETNWAGGSYYRSPKKHRAKVTLNGKPYCLTHLKRAEQAAGWTAIGARGGYIEDAEARAIVDEHRAVIAQRRERDRQDAGL